MSIRASTLAFVSMVFIGACGKATAPSPASVAAEPPPVAAAAGAATTAMVGSAPGIALARLERKIVRTANLDVEADDPRALQVSARGIVEELGGYVASSDVSREREDDDVADVSVSMVLRVPSEHFSRALDELKHSAARVTGERIAAEDVTEEFIDLEAHLRSEKALETQFVQILKDAKSVKDAMEVHTELSHVRSDIDKLEGRKQFLQSQSSLSTIHLGVTRHSPVVRASWLGFGPTFRRATSDAAATTAAIVHGAVRLLGVMLPVLLLIVLPLFLMGRAFLRRVARGRWQAERP